MLRKTWTPDELIAFSDEIKSCYTSNKIAAQFHLSGGNEKELIEIFEKIEDGDYVLSHHRNHYHALLHGMAPEVVRDRILNGRSMFMYDRKSNFLCSAIIGGTPAIAVGIAWALKRKGSKQRVWCFVTDGIEDNGHLYEAIRYVDGWDLPCTFIIENNNKAVDATNEERWGKKADYLWDSPSVIKYYYTLSQTHYRTPDRVDLSKAPKLTDEHCFPPLEIPDYPNYEELDNTDLSYQEAITQAMTDLGKEGAIFIGYSVGKGDAMGTLKHVPADQKIETPVAENLMMGLAIGMSLEGFIPVIFFERHDFMFVAMDAIGNHMDKIERLSHGEYKVPVIIRAMTADAGPFYSGLTHSQDLTKMLRETVSFPVIDPETGSDVLKAFRGAKESRRPAIIIERKSRL